MKANAQSGGAQKAVAKRFPAAPHRQDQSTRRFFGGIADRRSRRVDLIVAAFGWILALLSVWAAYYSFKVNKSQLEIAAVLPANDGFPSPTGRPKGQEGSLATETGKLQNLTAAKSFVVKVAVSGYAQIEGPRGLQPVLPGIELPGAGVVKSIEQVKGKWQVITSEGIITEAE